MPPSNVHSMSPGIINHFWGKGRQQKLPWHIFGMPLAGFYSSQMKSITGHWNLTTILLIRCSSSSWYTFTQSSQIRHLLNYSFMAQILPVWGRMENHTNFTKSSQVKWLLLEICENKRINQVCQPHAWFRFCTLTAFQLTCHRLQSWHIWIR